MFYSHHPTNEGPFILHSFIHTSWWWESEADERIQHQPTSRSHDFHKKLLFWFYKFQKKDKSWGKRELISKSTVFTHSCGLFFVWAFLICKSSCCGRALLCCTCWWARMDSMGLGENNTTPKTNLIHRFSFHTQQRIETCENFPGFFLLLEAYRQQMCKLCWKIWKLFGVQ